MKFTLKSTCNSGRLGILSNINRLQGFEMETPHVLLCTAGGTVPHLTYDVLQMVSKEKLGLNIPVQSVAHVQEQMKIYKHTIADYIGLGEYLSYCSYINPVEKNSHSTFINGKIKLKTRNGNQSFTPESYMQCIEDLKPDMFLLLADGVTNMESSKKRIKNAFSNSIHLFERCMDIYKASVSLKSSQILASVQGGFDLSNREQFSKLISESSVFGVVIDGLHDSDDTVMDISTYDVKPVVEASLRYIPHDKLRIIHGCWNPKVVLDLVKFGIDIFDSSYPFLITEQSGALIFPNTEDKIKLEQKPHCNGIHKEETDAGDFIESEVSKNELEEPVSKKMRLTKSRFHISMLDPSHLTDFTPIDKNCTCLTCKNHTRAYVHHLVNVKEMLGQVLLMVHNLHSYLVFFSTIRQQLKFGKFNEFCNLFEVWFNRTKSSHF